ncbi:hypothetical protein [Nevskia sp.]|uniref:hypothetical protein n=1 Tax=Nevskia sp. TaxID=1929292 RepID=UPI0025CF6B83|nr:hypothetical protein [Nevskia sp.]
MAITLPPRVAWREREPGEDIRSYSSAIEWPARFWSIAADLAPRANADVKARLAAYGVKHGEEARLRLREAVLCIRSEAQQKSNNPDPTH